MFSVLDIQIIAILRAPRENNQSFYGLTVTITSLVFFETFRPLLPVSKYFPWKQTLDPVLYSLKLLLSLTAHAKVTQGHVFGNIIVQPAERITPLGTKAPLLVLRPKLSLGELKCFGRPKLLDSDTWFWHALMIIL